MSFMITITITMGNLKKKTLFLLLLVALLIGLVAGDCTCDAEESGEPGENSKALNLKIVAIFSILVSGGVGIVLPLLSKVLPACQPGTDMFFMIKAFAAGVILATGFIHVLPDAFEHLTSPCLKEHPWGDFPFTGFISMVAAIGTLMVDTVARSYFTRKHFADGKTLPMTEDQETGGEYAGHVHVHTHASHGHSHGSNEASDLMRDRVISMVLELGIIVHSVIIGISLGTSQKSSTIKTLLVALSFHQFFEGMGLGGCMSQAKFKTGSLVWMALWFAFTTPIGIGIGIGISKFYNENSPTALIVEGGFNSASAGILIYMALVDLLAADFMSSKIQSNGKLQFLVNLFLLAGAGFMSLLAKWA